MIKEGTEGGDAVNIPAHPLGFSFSGLRPGLTVASQNLADASNFSLDSACHSDACARAFYILGACGGSRRAAANPR
jgi:hypothetical protein